MEDNPMKSRNKTAKLQRQKGALQRLEAQLKAGTKNVDNILTNGKTISEAIELTDGDVGRIKKEIEILKGRTSSLATAA